MSEQVQYDDGSWSREMVPALTLTDFLLARIAEDEWDARPFVNELGDARLWTAAEVGGRIDSSPNPLGGDDGEVATATTHMAAVHIARHDPPRVLAECEAKRAIVALAQFAAGPSLHSDAWVLSKKILCELATTYADHADYREEWKP